MEVPRPLIGVPGILRDGETRSQAPRVTLHILGERGVMVEEKTEEGSESRIIIELFTSSDEVKEEEELAATRECYM